MTEFPDTRESLLAQVRVAENREAWEEFVRTYRPVIYRLARRRGLQDADAEDLSQRVLLAVAAAIGHYEKSHGSVRFRHWLSRVVRNAILNALSRQPLDRAAGSTSVQELLAERTAPDPESTAQIELEYRRELYRRAASLVRSDVEPHTWHAFELTVIENRSIEQAAALLAVSIGSVYAARSRVMRRLRDAVRELETGK